MVVFEVNKDSEFPEKLNGGGSKLVIIDFSAKWCEPCKSIAPVFQEFSVKYPNAYFMKVDVEVCQETSLAYSVTSMPTFIFLRNKTRLDRLQGADRQALEAKIKMFYTESDQDDDSGVKGFIDMNSFIDKLCSECLNESDEHPYSHCLTVGGGYLESDCDEQLILNLAFNQAVKVHSLKIKAPSDKGPKNLRIFINQPNTLDFDKADCMVSTQDITLTPAQLDGTPITLKFVKYQNVQNMQLFFKDNHGGEETTQIDYLSIIGTPINTTNMLDFKRVAGKKGESH